jgi:hypothetical protein
MAGTWCTTDDVANLTGVGVTDPQLLRAQGVIETFEDIDPAAHPLPAPPDDHLSLRDRERLRKATAYQAGWMFEQIEIEKRTDVQNLSQDGQSWVYANPDAVVLAPLAKRNLDRLSWNADGPVTPGGCRAPYPDLDAVKAAVLCDEVELPWQFESWTL